MCELLRIVTVDALIHIKDEGLGDQEPDVIGWGQVLKG